jgi:hypothetical protein
MQGIQQAQQFAASLGLGGQQAPTQPPASAPAQPPAPVEPLAQPELPPAGVTPAGPPMAATAPPPPAATAPAPPSVPSAGFDQLAALMQALQQRQIPALPGAAPQQPAAAPPPQTDALGLLRTILTNPHLQQALQPAGGGPPQPVQLPVPSPTAPAGRRNVNIPLGAVLRALMAASGEALVELYEQTGEDEAEVPEYLVGEDGDFLVDPASDDDRAALVAHLFRLNEAAQQYGGDPQPESREDEAGEMDESDAFALAAGFP